MDCWRLFINFVCRFVDISLQWQRIFINTAPICAWPHIHSRLAIPACAWDWRSSRGSRTSRLGAVRPPSHRHSPSSRQARSYKHAETIISEKSFHCKSLGIGIRYYPTFGCVNIQNINPWEYNARASRDYSFEGLHRFSFFEFLSSSVYSKSPVLPLICIML